ncbi:hypothetical protein [Nocardioides lianchengensis]|uniref:hypothetical protein n=1 Tax=Nocardioides lianchengensis TaxID=1045774 RepID=UPI0017E60105|nr:hypothetical protein [Nocardioides lianchengensis]NYG11553.1 hypothetical protein [Nocardioides lianchengensis]
MSTATMPAMTYLPANKEIRDLLGDLLDKEVEVRPGPPFAITDRNPASVAVYVDDSIVVRAVICFDLALSAYAGAALALVPPAAAELAVEERQLSDQLTEPLHEVLNIAAALFNVEGAPHMKLYGMHAVGATPPDVRARSQVLGRRIDLWVDVAGYGTGRLAVVLT